MHIRLSRMFPLTGVTGLLAVACWGLSTVLTKDILATVPPLHLLFIQLTVSAIALWVGVIIRRSPLPTGRYMFAISLPGLLQPGLAYTLGTIGLSLTMVSIETVLWATETIFVLALAWLLLHERVSSAFFALSALAFVGIVMISVTGFAETQHPIALLGDGLILLASLCAASYTIVTRRMVDQLDPLVVTALHHTTGLVWSGVIWLFELFFISGSNAPVQPISPHVWIQSGISGIGQYALPFWLYLITLKGMPASRASLFLLLIPLFSVGGAALWLGERLTWGQWVGVSMILISIGLLSRIHVSSDLPGQIVSGGSRQWSAPRQPHFRSTEKKEANIQEGAKLD